jgi:hypothetical protein
MIAILACICYRHAHGCSVFHSADAPVRNRGGSARISDRGRCFVGHFGAVPQDFCGADEVGWLITRWKNSKNSVGEAAAAQDKKTRDPDDAYGISTAAPCNAPLRKSASASFARASG